MNRRFAAVSAVGLLDSAHHYRWDKIRNQKKACPYCIAGACLFLVLVPLAVPGSIAALEDLRRGRKRVR